MGCFTNQISSEWLDIVIVSMRWALNFFLNLKVIKGSSSYAIREIFTSSRRPTLLGKLSCRPTLLGNCHVCLPEAIRGILFILLIQSEAIYPTNTNRYVPPFVME
jgi:hypothetical protein